MVLRRLFTNHYAILCLEVSRVKMSGTLKVFFYVALGVVVVRYFILARKISKGEVQEPPLIPPAIPLPFIGHILGLIWYGTAYYTNIR